MEQSFYDRVNATIAGNNAMAGNYWGAQAYPGAYTYMNKPAVPQLPVFTNPMTEEEHKLLMSDGGFNTTRNKLDVVRDMCTHKHNGQITVFERKDDHLAQCYYCGKVWEMKDNYTHEDVENLVTEIICVIETIKTFLPNVSPDLARQLFAALGMIELIPSMFDYAMDTLNKMKQISGGIMPNQNSDYANTMNALFGLTGAVSPYMPAYGNYMASQMYNQNPAYYNYMQQQAQAYGAPAAPMQMGAPAPAAPMQMGGPAPAAPMQMGAPAPAANPWGAAPAGAPMQMGGPAPAANPWGTPANAWATPAGAPMDKPIGVVTPTAGGPAPMPGTMVTQNQVATTGPAPMQPTQANVPPAAPAPTGDAPAKDFKA